MFCALSGETPSEPVVSPRSGSVFEKRHIVRYLQTTPTDPITDEPLAVEDLIELNIPAATVPPQIARPQSIPALLADFQNEWDAIALEVYTLRKQLFQARQELSAALTHHDAAVRVVAKVMKERDDAREALLQLAASIGNTNAPSHITSIPKELIMNARDTLFKQHKSQKIKGIAADHELLIKNTQNLSIGSAISGNAFFDANTFMLLVCSEGRVVQIYTPTLDIVKDENYDGATAAVLLGDSLCVALPDKFLIDGTTFNRESSCQVLQIAPHPLLFNIFATRDSKSKFSLYDTTQANGSCVYESEKLESLSYIEFHVDGALLAAGTAKQVEIFSVLDGSKATTIPTTCEHIAQIIFALNGYWMIVLSHNDHKSVIDIVDLRKNSVIHSIDAEKTTSNIAIDASSTMLFARSATQTTVHRYTKKSKTWTDNCSSFSQDCGLILLDLITNANESAPSVTVISCGSNGNVSLLLLE